ncbi:uncharacterized protein LOC119681533 [Teleopsis dalmanni]|uniref:uncharacterized protein LOC119681533 n=1 Tax=Teleopsis dalmanni TaxID=139649 RepID=UPI0018CCFC08|nr:uncharacterized protein LOC119681533 [Teleopsis dalmanni]
MEHIDITLLIKKIKAKPVLWDKFTETYMDRIATRDAWREVCEALHPNFKSLSINEQATFRVEVFKRWKNLRDCYLKHKNKRIQATKRNGSAPIRIRKYIYADQLSFLNKIYEKGKTIDCMDEKEEVSNESSSSAKTSTKHKRMNEVSTQIIKTVEEEKFCYKATFLKSLMLHLEKFNNAEFLQFQMGALNLIQNINDIKENSSNSLHVTSTRFQSNQPLLDPLITTDQIESPSMK